MIDPTRTFLEQARVAYLSTVDLAGYLHTGPVWVDLDGDALLFSTNKPRVRLKHTQAHPKGTIAMGGNINEAEGYLLQGHFRIEPDNPALRHKLIRRYQSGEAAEQFIVF